MLRIGKLTGNVYDENTKPSSIGECCVMVKKKPGRRIEKMENG